MEKKTEEFINDENVADPTLEESNNLDCRSTAEAIKEAVVGSCVGIGVARCFVGFGI